MIDEYKDIYLIERYTNNDIKKLTMFFLLSSKDIITISDFIKMNNINMNNFKNEINNILDFYNDLIKFQNKNKSYLNYLTIFSNSNNINDITKYLKDVEKNKNFIKWIKIKDIIWIEKINNYFISKDWFKRTDNNKLYKK